MQDRDCVCSTFGVQTVHLTERPSTYPAICTKLSPCCISLSASIAHSLCPCKATCTDTQLLDFATCILQGTPHAHPAIPSALLFLQLVSLIALLLAWVYIFDTVQRERELLEGPKEGIIGAGGLQDPSQVAHTTTVFPPDREDSSKAKDEEAGEMSGQAVNIPPQMLVDSADGRSIGDMYAPMQGMASFLTMGVAASQNPTELLTRARNLVKPVASDC